MKFSAKYMLYTDLICHIFSLNRDLKKKILFPPKKYLNRLKKNFYAKNIRRKLNLWHVKAEFFIFYLTCYIKMTHLSWPHPNMSLIGKRCDILGTDQLYLFGGDYLATDRLRMNSTPVKGGFIGFPLFFLRGM